MLLGKKMIVYISERTLKVFLGIILVFIYFGLISKVQIPAFGAGVYPVQIIHLVVMGLALGTDAFSLSIGIGMKKVCAYDILKTSFVIGVFHVIMPLIGMFLGDFLGSFLGIYAKYVGSLLVIIIGANMLYECLKGEDGDCDKKLLGWSLVMLALSVSLDALTVGFGLGTYGFPIPLVVGVFGLLGGVMTAIGLIFGRFIGRWFGEKSEIIGGAVLIILGIKMLLS